MPGAKKGRRKKPTAAPTDAPQAGSTGSKSPFLTPEAQAAFNRACPGRVVLKSESPAKHLPTSTAPPTIGDATAEIAATGDAGATTVDAAATGDAGASTVDAAATGDAGATTVDAAATSNAGATTVDATTATSDAGATTIVDAAATCDAGATTIVDATTATGDSGAIPTVNPAATSDAGAATTVVTADGEAAGGVATDANDFHNRLATSRESDFASLPVVSELLQVRADDFKSRNGPVRRAIKVPMDVKDHHAKCFRRLSKAARKTWNYVVDFIYGSDRRWRDDRLLRMFLVTSKIQNPSDAKIALSELMNDLHLLKQDFTKGVPVAVLSESIRSLMVCVEVSIGFGLDVLRMMVDCSARGKQLIDHLVAISIFTGERQTQGQV